VATVVAGDEIDDIGEAEALDRGADRRFAVGGGDAESEAARVETSEDGGEVADRDQIGRASCRERVS
jgi:hypothetical protein